MLDGLLSISALVNSLYAPFLTTMMSNVGAGISGANSVTERPPHALLHQLQELRSQQAGRPWPFLIPVQMLSDTVPFLTTATCLVGV